MILKFPASPDKAPGPEAAADVASDHEDRLPSRTEETGNGENELGEEEQEEFPTVLHVATMTRNDKNKVKRIVMPKPNSGKLDVPKDIMEMWNSEKGREKLFEMWAKSGGMKAGILHKHTCATLATLIPLFCFFNDHLGSLHWESGDPFGHDQAQKDWSQWWVLFRRWYEKRTWLQGVYCLQCWLCVRYL